MAFNSKAGRIRRHKLITTALEKQLPPLTSTDGQGDQAIVICKLFTGSWTWYLLEYSPREHLAFGWVIDDTAPHCAELGTFSLDEIDATRGAFGLPVERDIYFKPRTLAEVKARHHQRAA
ncbi:MAG: DUF2958 domain-containing protein [Anaerolineae bacterium]|nr:DUF2958 domain-containing protein [Anaerolineae bacterium]